MTCAFRKGQMLALFFALSALAACVLMLFLVHVDQYTNMTTSQAEAQEERRIAELVAACQQAGGEWQGGFTTAGCNAAFFSLDEAWYITPIPNPTYELWQVLEPLLIVLACILALAVGWLLYEVLSPFMVVLCSPGAKRGRVGAERNDQQ